MLDAARLCRTVIAPALMLAGVVLGGCSGNPLGLKPGATSVLDSVAALPTPAEAVDMTLDKYDAGRRYRGTQLLSNASFAGEPLYVELFEGLLADKDPGVRGAAARALGLHGRTDHVPRLAEMLGDRDAGVRTEAARALQRLHNPVAVQPLIAAIDPAKEVEPAVRLEAARALGQYPEPLVVEKLIASLADASLAVNAATVSSLRTLTGQDFGYERSGWQAWYGKSERPFEAGSVYVYEGYNRKRKWWEYIPLIPPPPHEPSAVPVGLDPTKYVPSTGGAAGGSR